MKLGIMQPYLFPYIGYFQLIDYTDKWVVFDNVNYIQRGWVNRNRIIHSSKPEPIYFTVPVRIHSRETAIKDIEIDDSQNYINRILGQIETSYKKRAPYYKDVLYLVTECLESERKSLAKLNIIALDKVCRYLEIKFDYIIFSEQELKIDSIREPGDWALNISKVLNATEYVNPPGGISLFDKDKFKESRIELHFLQPKNIHYNQKKLTFIDNLSIIDVMMFNSKEIVKQMLKSFIFV